MNMDDPEYDICTSITEDKMKLTQDDFAEDDEKEDEIEIIEESSLSKKVAKFFINTLGLKNMISKLFIYHPPNPLYKFTAKGSVLNIEFQK